MQSLTKCLSGLSISNRPRAFASQNNGLCGYQRLAASRAQQVEQVSATVVCGKVKKIKTRKAVAKRFTVSGTGKIIRRRPGKQHINEKMSRAHLRKLGKKAVVEKVDMGLIAANLPYTGVKQSRN